MRIPVPIAIASCFLAIGVSWYFSTRNADFTTPPTEADKQKVAQQWKKDIPPVPDHQPARAPATKPNTSAPRLIKPKVAKPQIQPTLLPTGNLELSPQLTEYGTLGDEGADALIRLAMNLEQKGAEQHALLAWERVLDITEATPEQAKQASTAIQRLLPNLPPWNPDPTAAITITLNAGATLKNKTPLTTALQSIAQTMEAASGHILKVKIATAMGTGKPLDAPRVPIALWISRPGSGSTPRETPPLSILANPDQQEKLTVQCQTAVYTLLRSHLAQHTAFTPLPEAQPTDQPEDLLRFRITRLMWREFANSLSGE